MITSPEKFYTSSTAFSRKASTFVLIVLFFVFFEDFFRMISPVGGSAWLILKDLFIIGLYLVVLIPSFIAQSILLPRIATNIIVYIIFTILMYFYSVIGNESQIKAALVSFRVDVFYVPLLIIFLLAIRESSFPKNLYKLFYLVVVLNILVASVQFFVPNLLAGIPGFSGLQENEIFAHKQASFHNVLIDYVFGVFSGVGKFSRNVFNIFIWLWILHLVFNVGHIRSVLLISCLIGLTLIVAGKRLPLIEWTGIFAFIPIFILIAEYKSRNILHSNYWSLWSIKKIRKKTMMVILVSIISLVVTINFSSKAQLYTDFITEAITHKVEERFLGDSDTYFWRAEFNLIASNNDLAIFGQGAGTSTMGVRYIIPEDEFISSGFINVEHGPLKVWLEFGILGLFQMVLLWGGILIIDIVVNSSLRYKPRLLVASYMISIYHFSTLVSFFVGHQYWDDTQGQVHFWLITGMQIYLFRISKQQDKFSKTAFDVPLKDY